MQPVYVEDVAEAIARLLRRPDQGGPTFECGGPVIYRYKALIRVIAGATGRQPLLFPVPFFAWRAVARLNELSPMAPITVNQVELMQLDAIASPRLPGFAELGITPEPLESVLRRCPVRSEALQRRLPISSVHLGVPFALALRPADC